jgi:hypothetical protein
VSKFVPSATGYRYFAEFVCPVARKLGQPLSLTNGGHVASAHCFGRIGEEMAIRTRNGRNGSLEAAMALLLQNQAQQAADMMQIRKDFEEIKRYLIRHEQLLVNLPEAIREKIGFKN